MPSESGPEVPVPAVSSRDRMLQAAKHLFATRGYENTSTVAIARAAGTSESQLMKHFGSKEGLLEAIFDGGWGELSYIFRAIQDLDSPAEKLGALLDLTLKALEKDRELKELMLLEGRRVRKERNLVMLTRGFLGFVQSIDAVLLEMRSAGELRPELHPQAVRSALMGMFEGLLRDQLMGERMGYAAAYSSADLRKIFEVMVAAIVR